MHLAGPIMGVFNDDATTGIWYHGPGPRQFRCEREQCHIDELFDDDGQPELSRIRSSKLVLPC